jgi:CBS domain-containing protein
LNEEDKAMKVNEAASRQAWTCQPQTDLIRVGQMMREGDFGIAPVVDEKGRVVGVITDRDICVAAGTGGRATSRIQASELMQRDVACCRPDDDVRDALALMERRRVRRLPVTLSTGVLTGILSMDDIVLEAGAAADITAAEVIYTLKTICSQRLPVLRRTADA